MEPSKLLTIFNAWRTSLAWDDIKPELKVIFEARMDICGGCEFIKHSKSFEVLSNIVDGGSQSQKQKEFKALKCGKCGCRISWKASTENAQCPLKEPKWGKIKMNGDQITSTGLPNQINA